MQDSHRIGPCGDPSCLAQSSPLPSQAQPKAHLLTEAFPIPHSKSGAPMQVLTAPGLGFLRSDLNCS